jgi:hypothetical protein
VKRYYLSKIFQDVDGTYGIPGAYMHRIQTYVNMQYAGGEIAVDQTTGIPTQKVLLCLVETPNHVPLVADRELADFPEVALDTKVTAVAANALASCKGKMRALGLTTTEVNDIWQQADAVRNVIDRMGRLNNPAFNSLDFDLG